MSEELIYLDGMPVGFWFLRNVKTGGITISYDRTKWKPVFDDNGVFIEYQEVNNGKEKKEK